MEVGSSSSSLSGLSVRQLKELLGKHNIDYSSCVERQELLNLALSHNLTPPKTSDMNCLGDEKSPYLLQHKGNPVHWQPYGAVAFEKAKKEDKCILISIGYATCHWCHVMEHESFEDETVAKALNENFVAIKVDREELPDVDNIYMTAAQSMGVSGGWPLNVFVTPDLIPFFAGTYFPKHSFLNVLDRLSRLWKTDRSEIENVSKQLHEHLKKLSTGQLGKGASQLDETLLLKSLERSKESYDPKYGGFGVRPKFPPPMHLEMLLRIWRRTGDAKALEIVEGTLQGMGRGGIYDHLGGGFARYSTDEMWLIPHFEKMLCDNAQLIQLYVEAFQATKKPVYASIARETCNYILTVMQNQSEGGFYSAEDADSEGEEGKFYVWKKSEIYDILSKEEADLFCQVYDVTDKGNFEHGTTNLSLLKQSGELNWDIKDDPLIRSAHTKLFQKREMRVHPLKDDKQLTCWNGLMIKSLAIAARVLQDDSYRTAAQRAATFIRKHLYNEQTSTLLRRYRDGESKYEGTLDDYAYLISGLLELYQTDFNSEWLEWAITLQDTQDKLFWDEDAGGYFYSLADSSVVLIVRVKDFSDNACPNSNGVSAMNLLRLDALFVDNSNTGKYKKRAEALLKAAGIIPHALEAFFTHLHAIDFLTDEAKHCTLALPSADTVNPFVPVIADIFLPNAVFDCEIQGQQHPTIEDRPTAYVCEGTRCLPPTTDPAELATILQAVLRPYSSS